MKNIFITDIVKQNICGRHAEKPPKVLGAVSTDPLYKTHCCVLLQSSSVYLF